MTRLPRLLERKLRGALSQLPYLPRALGLAWNAARNWTLAWAFLLLLQGLLPVAIVYLTRLLVDSLVVAIDARGAWVSSRHTLTLVALMASTMLLSECMRSASGWVRTALSERLRDHISRLIHGKSTTVDLAFYESATYYDHLHRARAEAAYRPMALLENLGGLLQHAMTLLAMLTVLIPFGLWLPAVLLASTLPAFWVIMRTSLRHHQWRQQTTADERRTWYYDWLLTAGESSAELRLFGLGEHFQALYQSLRRQLRRDYLTLARRQSLAEIGAAAVALSMTGIAFGCMVWRALHGLITLGELALFYQAFNQGQQLMRALLENVGHVYTNLLFLGNLFEFLALEPQVDDPPQPSSAPLTLQSGLRFHQVTFRYPDSRRLALHQFSLTIPAGHLVAIVGPNGAGKSTLLKLICRLYDPDSGQIEWDGVNLRDFRLDDLRSLMTVLFQQPVHYNTTVSENIALGDRRAMPGTVEVEAAARAAGADTFLDRLPHGYNTLLGKWLAGGTELSVGEWQRLALARAFLRQAPLILLDEPTSAMDPWAEADWMQRFRQLAAGRTAVIITHRVTTAMRADLIHVMDQGRIVESGCHEELLTTGGHYATAWTAQFPPMPTLSGISA